MGFKIYLFALLVVYCTQGINASSEYKLVTSDRTSKDQLQTLLQTLNESVEVEVDSSVQIYNHFLKLLDNEDNKKLIAAILELAKAIITKTKALPEIVQIKECIFSKLEEVVGLVKDTADSLVDSGFYFGMKIVILANNAIKKLSPFVTAFKDFSAAFKVCGNVICKVRVLTDAQETVEEAKSNINEVWTSIQDFITKNVPEFREELQPVIKKAVTKSTVIITDVSKCISDPPKVVLKSNN